MTHISLPQKRLLPLLISIHRYSFYPVYANAIQNRITKQMETQMAADLQHLSSEYLALVATTQAELNQYVTEKYQQDKNLQHH